MKIRIYQRLATDLPINSVVSRTVVDDPYEKGAELVVNASLRDDPLRAMFAKKQIDSAQFQAGRKWQSLAEAAEVGSVAAIDPAKEAVDGGRHCEPITDHQIAAIEKIKAADECLGKDGAILIRDVLMRRLPINKAALMRGLRTQRDIDYLGRRFRECLETLAKHFHFC